MMALPAESRVMEGPVRARAGDALQGTVEVPGDKSISHRALLLGALTVGETRTSGLLEGEDVLRTAEAVRALGAGVTRVGPGAWHVHGVGIGGFREPDGVLDMGNSGTAARLLMGALAGNPVTATLTGDASLRGRPMARVTAPLEQMGAVFAGRGGGRLPITMTGSDDLMPIDYTLPVASAQVKSAVLLAGLAAPGCTIVTEPAPSRDHTEILLGHLGAELEVAVQNDGARRITLTGQPELSAPAGGLELTIPGDISSAAFPLVAALIVPGSRVLLRNVGVNPLRTGLIDTLQDMGAKIERLATRTAGGEPAADLQVAAGRLEGVRVPPERAPSMIDEYPVLAAAAAWAHGETLMEGIGELRVKESDRLAAIADGLAANGVEVEAGPDFLRVQGCGGPPPGGGTVATELDHRIAMTFLVLGLAARAPVTIDDAAPIATSFPGFIALMQGLGADLSRA